MPILKIIIKNSQFVDIQEKLKELHRDEKEGIVDYSYRDMVEALTDVPNEEFIETYVSQLKYLLMSYVRDNRLGDVLGSDKEINVSVDGKNIIDVETDKPEEVMEFFQIDRIFDEHFLGMYPHVDTEYIRVNKEDLKELSQRELQKLLDYALDNRDFDTVKMISPYIRENKHVMCFEKYVKLIK